MIRRVIPAFPERAAKEIFWFAALAAVLLILLHESLFCGKGLAPADGVLPWPPWSLQERPSNYLLGDQYYVFLPGQEFLHRQNSFPCWNPSLCCGVPWLGSIQGAPLFPIRLLFSPLDPFSASGPCVFLKLCLAGWFTMLYVRLLGASGAASFLAGLVFSLSGFMIVWLGHPLVNSAMWLPLLLYFLEKTFKEGRAAATASPALRAWAGFSVAFAFMILGGHPPTAIHVTLALGFYFIFRQWGDGREKIFQRACLLGGSAAVGLLLAAPQILPYLEYYRQSSSAQSSALLGRWASHLSFPALIHYLLPNALGNPAAGFDDLPNLLGWREADNFNERTGYVGIVPLFFAACAVALRRCKFTKFFCFLAIGSLLVACGCPPFPGILRALPVLCDVNHTRLLLVAGFSLAVLAGLGVDELFRGTDRRRARAAAVAFCAVAGAALLLFLLATGPKIPALDPPHWAFLRRQFLILAGGMAAVLLSAFWPARWNGRVPMAVCLGWTAGDLLCFACGYNPAIPRDRYYPPAPAVEWLQQDRSLFRITGVEALPPNTAEVFGLSDARGMDYMTVRRYEELITGRAGDFFFYSNVNTIPAALRLLNVKYILSPRALPLNPDLFELAYSKDISIYRFKECLERALLVCDYEVEPDPSALLSRVLSSGFDPQRVLLLEDQPVPAPAAAVGRTAGTNAEGAARVVSYEPDDVVIDASLSRPGFLLLLDTYFPGWSATVNGKPAPILRADYNFRAVSLPAGEWTVRFSYRPASLRLGMCLCALGLLALGAACFPPWKWKPREAVR
jgi:hypothetical protein